MTPALAVDGVVKVVGKTPSRRPSRDCWCRLVVAERPALAEVASSITVMAMR
jgi:hypothetical protein